MKVYCNLTQEQGSLYAAVVDRGHGDPDRGRRHPAQGRGAGDAFQAQAGVQPPGPVPGRQFDFLSGRSGKLARLVEMLEEVLEAGERALVFTQFSEMGEIIKTHLQETFGEAWFCSCTAPCPRSKRDRMVEEFQEAGVLGLPALPQGRRHRALI